MVSARGPAAFTCSMSAGQGPALDRVVQEPGGDQLLVEAGIVKKGCDLQDVVEKESLGR